MEKAKVYFTKSITSEKVIEMYKVLGIELSGKVAVKVHSGEKGNQNFLRPEFLKPMIEYVNGTVVECNTAYDGASIERLLPSTAGQSILMLILWTVKSPILNCLLKTAECLLKILWASIFRIMIQCLCFLISRVTRWAATAER